MKLHILATIVISTLLAVSVGRSREVPATVEDPDGYTNVRDESGKVVGRVKVGERFLATEPADGSPRWPVRLASGVTGYIHESRIRRLEGDQGDTTRAQVPRAVEQSISGIRLGDPDSAERILGKKIKVVETDGGFPTAHLLNATRTEKMELIVHYGGLVNDFVEVTVEQVAGAAEGRVLKSIPSFITGRGIRLGMDEAGVKAALGSPKKIERTGKTRVLHYEVTRDLPLGYPLYYGRYTFRDGKLAKFEFGYEYP